MGTYAYDAANDTLSLVAGTGDTDALAAKLTKTSNNIAPLQSGSTASSLIPVGEYFINSNGDLCQCDVQINADSAIVIGTNCHVVQKGISNDLNGKISSGSGDSGTWGCKYQSSVSGISSGTAISSWLNMGYYTFIFGSESSKFTDLPTSGFAGPIYDIEGAGNYHIQIAMSYGGEHMYMRGLAATSILNAWHTIF